MTVEIENEAGAEFGFDYRKVAEDVIRTALDTEGFPYEAEVHLLIVTDKEMQAINREARGIDRTTDVLSFPFVEYEKPGTFDRLEAQADVFHPDSGEAVLGDIVLSAEKAAGQAAEYGHSLKREYAFLIAHSMLHLLGYDHMQPEESAVMEAHQDHILDLLKITR